MVSYSLEGKVALVTGAAYGIGFAMAEALAQAGAKIAFNCRSEEHLQKALDEYRAKGIEAKGYICDVRDEKAVAEMIRSIEQELGAVDILVKKIEGESVYGDDSPVSVTRVEYAPKLIARGSTARHR